MREARGGEKLDALREAVDILGLQREANERLVLAALRAHDGTEEALIARQRAERQAAEARAREVELRVTAEFRERFVGIIGHDLRNPLETIVMAGGLLLSRGDLTESDAQLVSRMIASGQQMEQMLAQLVEFTRGKLGGGFVLKRVPASLGDICRDVAEALRLTFTAEIRQRVDGDVSGSWDAHRLRLVIESITTNALSHAAPGTPVDLHVYGSGDEVVVSITNRGVSIPANVLATIFDAYRGAEVGERRSSGRLGLGLHIASEVVRAHGGRLEAASGDMTTTFTMHLPRTLAPLY